MHARRRNALGPQMLVATIVLTGCNSILDNTDGHLAIGGGASGGTQTSTGGNATAGNTNSGGTAHAGTSNGNGGNTSAAGSGTVGGTTGLGGLSSSGGVTNAGGSSTGGSATSAGGTQAASGSGNAGGSVAGGGTAALGGATSATGGASPAGGASAIGGAGGGSGTVTTGGTTSPGTITSGGGITSAGGATSTGGAVATGGTATTGGNSSIGGGSSSSGGSGGTNSTGGSVTGGAATGGSPITGGASSTAPSCTIDSGNGPVSYSMGNRNPANRCLVCNPTVSTTTWTPDAGSCGCTGSLETLDSTGRCVAKMVVITAPSSMQNYSIDVTEVTKTQYDLWLATNPALPASTDASCGYVTSYAEQGTGYTGTDAGHHPVRYVDWCDAYAYCKGVGKRLCGAIGGGSVDYSAGYKDATQSQWYRACSFAGANTYPYGNTYQATYCNGSDYGAGQTVAVGSLASCVTPTTDFAGVYDLSGNVDEWEDSCNGSGQSASCHLHGGAFEGNSSTNDYLTCGDDIYAGRYIARSNVLYGVVGFRCCSP